MTNSDCLSCPMHLKDYCKGAGMYLEDITEEMCKICKKAYKLGKQDEKQKCLDCRLLRGY